MTNKNVFPGLPAKGALRRTACTPQAARNDRRKTAWEAVVPTAGRMDDPYGSLSSILGIGTPRYGRRRDEYVKIPDVRVVPPILRLARWLDELEKLEERGTVIAGAAAELLAIGNHHVTAIRQGSKAQETVNSSLHPKAMYEETHMLHVWWDTLSKQHSDRQSIRTGFIFAEHDPADYCLNYYPA